MSDRHHKLVIGAVAYAPKVVTIWQGFCEFFSAHGLPSDYRLYSNYESQVDDHFRGAIDVAWNSPLAFVRAQRVARSRNADVSAPIMRDTDRDLSSVILVRAGSSITSLDDLRGRRLAVGALDSPQARLIPLGHLAAAGLDPRRDLEVRRFDVMVGQHGDHVGGERDAVAALLSGDVDAAAIISGNRLAFAQDGLIPDGALTILSETDPYDHCVFTVIDGHVDEERLDLFSRLLLSMSFDDPAVRGLLDLEGLRQWLPGRTSGFAQLEAAVDLLGFLAADGSLIDPDRHT